MEISADAEPIPTFCKQSNWLLNPKLLTMENPDYSSHPFEPKQNELPPKPSYDFALDRRKFFKITGGGLIIAFVIKDLFSPDSETPPSEASSMAGVESWIHIGEDGTVSVYTGKVEVGQNIRTSLSQ